jgi:hypothetical protein
MARWRKRRWEKLMGWAAAGAAGLGAGAAVLSLLEPGRRARARQALDRVGHVARETGERLSAAGAELPRPEAIGRRPGVLGAVLIGRALLGGGLLRIPFALAGLSALARAASSSERGRAALGATTRAVRSAADALRSMSRTAAERATSSASRPAILGPDANPVT